MTDLEIVLAALDNRSRALWSAGTAESDFAGYVLADLRTEIENLRSMEPWKRV